MSDDPKIVIRTEFDSKGIYEAQRSHVQMSQDLQKHMENSAKAANAAQENILKAQVRAGKEAAKELLSEHERVNQALQRIAEEGSRRVAAAAKSEADEYQKRSERIQRIAEAAAARGAAAEKAAEIAKTNEYQKRAEMVQRIAESAAKRDAENLDAEVKRVQKAADEEYKIRLANEEKIRSGLRFLRNEGSAAALMSKTTVDSNSGNGVLGTVTGALAGLMSPTGILGRIGSFVGAGLLGAANAFKNAMGAAIDWIGRTIQITIGVLLRDIANWFVRTIQNGIETAVTSVAGVERLFISLTTQGQIENQSNGMDATTALSRARVEAGRYLAIVRELAIYSPFSVEDVQNIYRTYAAYGLTRAEATKLTSGMIDLSSAFAVTGAEAQRASLAVAQIIARGRATGEEIRQLVNSGLPLMSKLADKLGVTKQEFSNMAKEGKLTTEVLMPALRELFAEFEGAGARASMTTFTGLLSSLGDIGPMILQEFFGPINQATGEMEGLFGALIPRLRQLVDFFTSPRTLGTIKDWGIQLGNAVSSAMDWAFGSLDTDVSKKVKQGLDKSQSAFSWGYNLMVQYGNGIIRAGREVLRALANIGRMIMKFLKPNSPPLILPDIDQWGKETMEQWLQGFTQADANSVFSTLSSELGGLMKGLMAQVEDKAVLPNMLMGLNESLGDLVKAYSSGNGLAEVQARITSMFGAAAPVVQNYVQALLNAQTASTAVAGAERNLATVTKYYEGVLENLDAQIKALQNTQKDIGDEVEVRKLNLILNSQFTTEDRKAQARARLEELRLTKVKRSVEEERDAKVAAAQAAVDAAKLEQDKRDEQLAAAKAMLDFYQMQNDLLNDSVDAVEDLSKALKDAAGAMGDSIDDLLGLLGGEDPFTGKQKSEKWDIFGPWREEMDLFTKDWDEFWAGIGQAVEDFKNSYAVDVFSGINVTSLVMAEVTDRNIDRMKEAWNTLPDSVKGCPPGRRGRRNRR